MTRAPSASSSVVSSVSSSSSEPKQPQASRDKHSSTPASSSHIKDAVAGFCAGAFSKTAVAPIERVKLLMQLQGSLPEHEFPQYRNQSAWHVAKTVAQTQGILAFWRGNLGNVLMQAGSSSLNFMLMDYYKAQVINPIMMYTLQHFSSTRTMAQRRRRRTLWTSFLSGGLAGATATTVLYPLAFLRTRVAMDVGSSSSSSSSSAQARNPGNHRNHPRLYPHGMRDALYDILHMDGIRGLFQGYGIALVGGIAYRALHLGGYDALKTEILRHRHDRIERHGTSKSAAAATATAGGSSSPNSTSATVVASAPESLSWIERIAAAQCVSLVSAAVMYPFDSVRRRLMMQAGIVPESKRLYRNSWECVRVVLTTEGIKGLYLGLGPNLVRSVGGALLLVAYDGFKAVL